MVEIKYDELSPRIQISIDEFIRNEKKLNKEQKENAITKINNRLDEQYNTDFDISEVERYIESRRRIHSIRKEVFHPKEGIISLFRYHGDTIKNMSWGGDVKQKVENVISKLIDNKDATSLEATNALREDDEKINRLKILVGNNPLTGYTDKPFTDEEVNLVKVMVNKVTDKVAVADTKTFEYESVDKMKKLLTTFNHVSLEDRRQYYAYWKSVSAKFKDFYRAIFTFNREVEVWKLSDEEYAKVIADTEERGSSGELATAEQAEQFPQARKDLISIYADAQVEYGKGSDKYKSPLEIPNYVIELRPLPIQAESEEDKILKLVNSYLNTIPNHIKSEYLKIYDKEAPESGQKLEAERGEVHESTESEAERTSIPEVKEVVEDSKERHIKWQQEWLDPIFAITTQMESEKLNTNYSESIIESAKKELTQYMKTGKGDLADEIVEFMKDNVNKFMDEYAKVGHVTATDNVYYIPILDDDRHVKIIDALIQHIPNYQIAVDYIVQNGSPQTKMFANYGEAVDWVNKRTIRFFNNLNKVLKMKDSKYGLSGKAGRVSTTFKHGAYYEGGRRRPYASTLTKPDKELFEANEEMNKAVKEYYTQPMTDNRYLINRDRPDFFSDSSFRNYIESSGKDPIQLVLNDVVERGTPIDISAETLKSLNNLIEEIRKGNKQVFVPELKTVYSKAVKAMMKIFTSLPRDKKKDLRDTLRIAFGDMLYEIAMAHHQGDKKLVGDADWEGRKLTYWNKQEKQTGENIPYIAELILRPEWEEVIGRRYEMTDDKELWKEHKKLVDNIWNLSNEIKLSDITNAMLYTKDLLLKMKGETQYIATMDLYNVEDISFVADLIQKEDRLDIYATDIEKIVKHQGAFKTVADSMGIDEHIVYKIKGMFRGY